jgi:hypothetical protein
MSRASWKTILAVAVILWAGLLAATGLSAAAASTAAQTARHAPAVPVFMGTLGGVSATSAADAWAVGDQCPSCSNPGTLILHWNGTRWSIVSSPDPGSTANVLNDVAAVSSSDAWAVGSFGNSVCSQSATVILHWNGAKWSQVKSPNAGACNRLDGINASSATSAWAVGQTCTFAVNHCHTLIVRWNGTAWSRVVSPNPGADGRFLAGVSADSPSDAWAAGSYCTSSALGVCPAQDTMLLRWNGTKWSQVPSPNPGPLSSLDGVTAVSPTDAWAVGSYCTTTSCAVTDTLLLRWNGTKWSQVPSPSPGPIDNSLNGVTAVSPTDVWVTGDYCAPKCGGHVRTLIMHWNGTAWTTVSSPDPGNINFLTGVAATASGNAWTVGGTCLTSVCGTNTNALVLHWNGSAWTVSSG